MSIESIPQSDEPVEISCDNCVGACCKAAATLILNKDETYRHRRAMTTKVLLRPKDYPQQYPIDQEVLDKSGNRGKQRVMMPVPRNYGLHILLTDCGNLTDDYRCGVYEDRPGACVNYEVGSEPCLAARAAFGLDGHEATVPLVRDEPIKVNAPRYHPA